MSDKPLVQQALATELADILLKIPDPSSSLLFLKGFWQTVIREWHGIDRLRWTDHNLKFASSFWLTYRAQDGQVLYVDSAFRQRLLHSVDQEWMVSAPLRGIQFYSPFPWRSFVVRQNAFASANDRDYIQNR